MPSGASAAKPIGPAYGRAAIGYLPPPGRRQARVGSRPVSTEVQATGRCLCGAVSYEIRGALRDVLLCHCVECRRWSGHLFAATAVEKDHLRVSGEALRWISSPASETQARRGFCGECGSSLFWDAPGRSTISVAAGTLDEPTGLRLLGHTYTSQQGDYYPLEEGQLPRYERLPPAADGRANSSGIVPPPSGVSGAEPASGS